MNIFCKYGTFVHELATMAQEVERRLGKAEVTGSIPVSATIVLYILILKSTDKFPCLTSILRTNKSNKVFLSAISSVFAAVSSRYFSAITISIPACLFCRSDFTFLGKSKSSAAINGTAFKV